MKRLDRYIFREILTPGLIALVAMTFIVFSRRVGQLLDIVVRQSPSASEVGAIVAAILPIVLTVTIPMGVLVGILTGFSRMSSDSEAIALRASGISMWRLLRPVMVFATLACAATFALTVWVAPATTAHVRTLQAELVRKYPSIDVKTRNFYDRDNFPLLYVNEAFRQPRGVQARGILLIDTKNPEKPEVTTAESGSILFDEATESIQFRLFNSSKHMVSPGPTPQCKQAPCYDIVGSSVQNVSWPFPLPAPSGNIPIEEVTTRELWERIQSGDNDLANRAAFHQRLAMPFACLAFALLGLPLGVSTSRGGRSIGLVLSLMLMFAYYLAFFGGSRATTAGGISPVLGAWLPNVAFTILGLILMARSDREYQNRVMAFLGRIIEKASGAVASLKLQGRSTLRSGQSLHLRFRLLRLLDAYVLRGFLFFFVIVLGVFASLFIVVTLFELLPFILQYNAPASLVVKYFVFFLPQVLYWVIPLAVLLANLISLGTLTKSNEILAVKAGAISLYRMSLPLILMGALLSGTIYLMQEYLLPWTNKRQDEYHDIIKNRPPQTYRDPSRKWMMGSANRLYNYSLFDADANTFANISVLTLDAESFQVREWLYAKRGTWTGGAWSFEEGWVREIPEDRSKIHLSRPQTFSQRSIATLDAPSYFRKEVREADQMSYRELESYVANLRQSGLDVSGLTVDLYRKLSFPLVSLIMTLIGIPFSFKTGRKGAFYGIGFCLAVGILYWLSFELFEILGGTNQLEPFVAAWFPNLIFGASGLWLMLRVKT